MYIREHYADEDLNQQALADAAFVGGRHLTRLFRQFAAMTPMQYVKNIRLQQAQVLLETSNLSMREITQEIGLKDSLHFSRVFRQVYGVSPTVYRESR
ncbi:MAG: helix-turn-helix transcriptional regulator [Planctomycetes bacterium]|nr:helix-turn-helix transcriptional regulator [Planctomycetota bacterium]